MSFVWPRDFVNKGASVTKGVRIQWRYLKAQIGVNRSAINCGVFRARLVNDGPFISRD